MVVGVGRNVVETDLESRDRELSRTEESKTLTRDKGERVLSF